MPLSKVALVFNPKGGTAKSSAAKALGSRFEARGVRVEYLTTTPEPGSATHLGRQAARDGCKLVVAIGGDGTVCQTAEGLIGHDVPLAVYPGGTGNLFARAYGPKLEPEAFVELAMEGEPQPIDMASLDYEDLKGKRHERLFMVAFGLGKISDAISTADPELKRLFGTGAYVAKVTRACLDPEPVAFTVTTPRTKLTERSSLVFALNVAPPAMALLSRGCNASDGLLDVVVCRGTNLLELVSFVSSAAAGEAEKSRHFRRLRARSVTIEASGPVVPNIDGDPGEPTRAVRLEVRPGAVRMVLSH